MKIYNYSNTTGEYLGESDAHPSPLEPGVFLIPAWATKEKPPASKKGKTPVFKDGKWSLVEDHRRNTVYSTSDGSPLTVQDMGPLPEGYTDKEFPGLDHVWNGRAWKLDEPARRARLERDVRAKRDALLKACDWSQLPDVHPKHRATYGVYRAQLRDITTQTGFPENVEWPDKP